MNKATATTAIEQPVRVEAGPVTLEGNLGVPQGARGVVLLAHGSGSGRHSPRNRHSSRAGRASQHSPSRADDSSCQLRLRGRPKGPG